MVMPFAFRHPRISSTWAIIGLVTAIGLGLRIACATGGLWLDEAWSAVFARESATLAGAIVNINHDNNHLLNTIWLQIVGLDAPPVVQRALSIITGTAAIPVAAAIGVRRNAATAILAAALFAVSPVLVTYGSEARGYAPMLLALLIAIWLVDGWLDVPDAPPPARGLAIAIGVGALAQLTIAFGLVAIMGWIAVVLARRMPVRGAAIRTVRATAPAMLALAAVIALTFAPAVLSMSRTFQFGSLDPFAWGKFVAGLADLMRFLFGGAMTPLWLVAWAGIAALLPAMRQRAPFYILAMIGFPLGVAMLGLGNSGIARYYLLVAVAALLFLAEAIGAVMARAGGLARWFAVGIAGIVIATSLITDARLIANQRGDPAAAVRTMERLIPTGTRVAIDHPRASAVLEVAAAQAGYALTITEFACPPAPFLFIDRDGDAPFPLAPTRCGVRYEAVAGARTDGLSGNHWRLYRRMR